MFLDGSGDSEEELEDWRGERRRRREGLFSNLLKRGMVGLHASAESSQRAIAPHTAVHVLPSSPRPGKAVIYTELSRPNLPAALPQTSLHPDCSLVSPIMPSAAPMSRCWTSVLLLFAVVCLLFTPAGAPPSFESSQSSIA